MSEGIKDQTIGELGVVWALLRKHKLTDVQTLERRLSMPTLLERCWDLTVSPTELEQMGVVDPKDTRVYCNVCGLSAAPRHFSEVCHAEECHGDYHRLAAEPERVLTQKEIMAMRVNAPSRMVERDPGATVSSLKLRYCDKCGLSRGHEGAECIQDSCDGTVRRWQPDAEDVAKWMYHSLMYIEDASQNLIDVRRIKRGLDNIEARCNRTGVNDGDA